MMELRQSLSLVAWLASNLSLITLVGADGIWNIDIDRSPAPAPPNGPPFSAYASRNRALLPAQICGIIGSYLGTVFLILTLLLTFGRRLRRKTHLFQGTLGMELVKPVHSNFEPSPVSPVSDLRSWYNRRRSRSHASASNSVRSRSNPASPGIDSVASFDANVIEADKLARQQEMERLYAAVMAQDDERESKADTAVSEIEILPTGRQDTRRPLRLITTAPALQHLRATSNPASPSSPTSPKSPVRAIYPPDSPRNIPPTSPTSPLRAGQPNLPPTSENATPLYDSRAQTASKGYEHHISRESSIASHTSAMSRPKRLRKSLGKISISAPIQKYPGEEDSDSARTPLTPRYYSDPGEPSSPPKSEAATIPGTYGSPVDWSYESGHQLETMRSIPRPSPQRPASHEDDNRSYSGANVKRSRLPLPASPADNRPPLSYRSPHAENATPYRSPQLGASATATPFRYPESNASNGTMAQLPFRAMQPNSPLHPLRSPGLQTTYLERRRDIRGLNGPRTGLAVPYSPYMPYTPVTPVTPHLTSRAERRQREREEGRRMVGQEDAVIDEEDMWGSAY